MSMNLEHDLRALWRGLPPPPDAPTSAVLHAARQGQVSRRTSTSRWLGKRRLAAVVIALALAGGGALAANQVGFGPGDTIDTPAEAELFFEDLSNATYGELGQAELLDPETAELLASFETDEGVVRYWRASSRDGESYQGFVFSSPRGGVSAMHGVQPAPDGPVNVLWGLKNVPGSIREIYGRVSPQVASIEVELKNGSRLPAAIDNGWFFFADDSGHAPPKIVHAFDAEGREIGSAAAGF